MGLKLIAAVSENMGMGYKGGLPWRLKKEIKFFADMTTTTQDSNKKNVCLMGRNTWESIPSKFKPLPNRINVIISRTMKDSGYADVPVFTSLGEALERLSKPPYSEIVENTWIIGGSMLYEEAFRSNFCDGIYLTRINRNFECDTFFPKIPDNFEETYTESIPNEVQEENGISFRFTFLRPRLETKVP